MEGVDLSERDVTLAFVMSRMRVVDEQSKVGRLKLTRLSFEDWLEALCRCSACKSWPTAEEVEAAGTITAGKHLHWLRSEDADVYDEMLKTRAVAWGEAPPQPISVCVDNLCSLLVLTCQGKAGDGTGELSEKQARKFFGDVVGSEKW